MDKAADRCSALLSELIDCANKPITLSGEKLSDQMFRVLAKMQRELDHMDGISRIQEDQMRLLRQERARADRGSGAVSFRGPAAATGRARSRRCRTGTRAGPQARAAPAVGAGTAGPQVGWRRPSPSPEVARLKLDMQAFDDGADDGNINTPHTTNHKFDDTRSQQRLQSAHEPNSSLG